MPSGAKRRKAAKKKKAAANPNGNGEVKVVESDGGDNSSPASQDLETQQNPFTKDVEDKEFSVRNESVENGSDGMLNGDLVESMGEEAKSKKGGLNNSTNGSVSEEDAANDVSQLVENGNSGEVKLEPVAKEVNHVKDDIHNNPDKATLEPAQNSVGFTEDDLKLNKYEEKVHPSETFSDLESESLQIPDTNREETSRDFVAKSFLQSSTQFSIGELNAGSSDIQHSAEKEPLLPRPSRQVNKTSWTGCCGILELLTGSSR